MQFSSILVLLGSAAIVAAVPNPGHKSSAGGSTNNGNACKVNQKQACCKTNNSGALSGLLGGSCELNILGQNCAGQSACCQVDGSGSILGGSCQPLLSL